MVYFSLQYKWVNFDAEFKIATVNYLLVLKTEGENAESVSASL